MEHGRRQAIVMGGSMAGLLAARVLSDHFDHVTVIERDRFPEGPEHRKGVPQGRHFHILLKRGEAALARFFPDLAPALTDGGAPVVDIGADMRIYQYGDYKVQCATEACLVFLSRPFLEWHVRQRVLSRKNVAALDQCDVGGLITNGDHTRVSGVTVQRSPGRGQETLEADLVVDATGRGSQSAAWLEGLGYPRPPETTVTVDLSYTSRVYRRTPADLPGAKAAYALPKPPHEKRFGALFEPAVQHVTDTSSILITLTSYTYWLSQFAVVGLTLAWVYFRHHERFTGFRNWLIVANLIGLVGYVLVPTAPPRMFPEWGFIDTLGQYSSLNHDSGLIALAANPYAAMPSLHAMDAFIVGVVMASICRSRIAKALWFAWPVWVAFAVVSTGNHYWLDVVAGVLIAIATGIALRRISSLRLRRA